MAFSEMPASKKWAALKYKAEKFADVWFKPEGEPLGLTFRIPRESFHILGMGHLWTIETLLKAVGIALDEVESWQSGADRHSSVEEARTPLTLPPHAAYLEIHVRLKQAPKSEPRVSQANWQDLETRWKAILTLEASMDTLRISTESLQRQLEAINNKSLTMEEKTHAPRADVAQWTKARKRVHTALPKMKDFIHRATWAVASADRKRLEQVYKDHIQPHIAFPEMTNVLKQLEDLQKDRQVLLAHGQMVMQECRTILAEVQGTLRTLQNNAATNARRKKG